MFSVRPSNNRIFKKPTDLRRWIYRGCLVHDRLTIAGDPTLNPVATDSYCSNVIIYLSMSFPTSQPVRAFVAMLPHASLRWPTRCFWADGEGGILSVSSITEIRKHRRALLIIFTTHFAIDTNCLLFGIVITAVIDSEDPAFSKCQWGPLHGRHCM